MSIPVPPLRALLLGGLLALLGCDAATPQHPDVTGTREEFPLRSQRVDDTFRILVRLPPGYADEPERRFPVVLQLDATLEVLQEFDVTAGFASELEAQGTIPPTLVVGIGYDYPTAAKTGRNRDYTLPLQHPDTLGGMTSGGAEQFLAFLRTELVPELEQRYRIRGPGGRALFGHSLGGLFVEYALYHYDPAAPFVTGFVSASASLWFDNGAIYEHFEAFRARQTEVPLIVLRTAGGLEGPVMTVYSDDLSRRTREAGFAGLRFETREYSTGHVGTVAPSFRDGLEYLFQNGLGTTP